MARSKRTASSEFDPESYDDDIGSVRTDQSGDQLKQVFFDVLSRWPVLALGLICGILGGIYYFSKAPKIYEATATLLVTQGGGDVRGAADSEQLDLRSSEGMNTLAVRIKRLEFLREVAVVLQTEAGETGLKSELIPSPVDWFPEWSREWIGGNQEEKRLDPDKLDSIQLARFISSWTNVGIVEFTRLLEITVAHPNPEIASLVANTIAVEYEKELSKERSSSLTTTSNVLDTEANKIRREIQEMEKALANYETTLEALAKVDELEGDFAREQRRYKEKHPIYINAKLALQQSRERFLDEFGRVRQSSFDSAYWEEQSDELADEDSEVAEKVRKRRQLLRARATTLGKSIETQNNLNSEFTATAVRSMAARSDDAIGVESSSMSQVPGSPSQPVQSKIISTGGFVGLGVSLLFVLLLVKLDTQIHTIPQVENLTNLPVLATIRLIEPKILRKIIKEKGKTTALENSPASRWDPHIVFRPGLTESLFAETFRILRASVALLGDEKKRNVTLFSSVLPGEGKTLISTNFAIASAQQGKRTLLLDLDLRKPAIHKNFGFRRSQLKAGVTELLAGQITWQEALSRDVGQENLTCIFAGKKAPNPGELLSSNVVADLLQTLEAEFDVVVIDSAPILAVSDTRLIIPEIDNFCLVVRAEQTPVGAIRKGLALLEDDGTNPSGIVVNAYEEKAGFFTRKYRYGYGYGGYGQYYGKDYGYGKSYGSYGSDDDDD